MPKHSVRFCIGCGREIEKRVLYDGQWHRLGGRKYCLSCSPYKSRRGTLLWHARRQAGVPAGHRRCPRCDEVQPFSEFHKNKSTSTGYHTYCKRCARKVQRERHNVFRASCIEHAGGKCIKCGYSRCVAALEFHHRDPGAKDFQLSKAPGQDSLPLSDTIRAELDKCDLVCANCHAEIHWEVLNGNGEQVGESSTS